MNCFRRWLYWMHRVNVGFVVWITCIPVKFLDTGLRMYCLWPPWCISPLPCFTRFFVVENRFVVASSVLFTQLSRSTLCVCCITCFVCFLHCDKWCFILFFTSFPSFMTRACSLRETYLSYSGAGKLQVSYIVVAYPFHRQAKHVTINQSSGC